MNATEINLYLGELADEIKYAKYQSEPIQILVFGGAVMTNIPSISQKLSKDYIRLSTYDVDVMFLDESKIKQDAVKHAASIIATKHQLPIDWINDKGAGFPRNYLQKRPMFQWKDFGVLQVFFPTLECQWALKIIAGRSKDGFDILALSQILQIKTRDKAQELINQFVDADIQYLTETHLTIQRHFSSSNK